VSETPTRRRRRATATRMWLLPTPEIGSHLLRSEDEVIIDEVTHHWICYVKPALLVLVGVGLMVAALFVHPQAALLLLAPGALIAAWGAFKAAEVRMDVFVVTNMRVFRMTGVLSQTQATMPLSRILDITVHKPLLGRLLGYGHFTFESAAQEQGLREIHTVPRVDERDLTIQGVVQRAGLRGPRQPRS
jgi:membrane protein YdbS with pleckstrin-like domain